ncbi:MAG: hypothetical protein ACM3ON_05945 [Chloroflexota bacterium]
MTFLFLIYFAFYSVSPLCSVVRGGDGVRADDLQCRSPSSVILWALLYSAFHGSADEREASGDTLGFLIKKKRGVIEQRISLKSGFSDLWAYTASAPDSRQKMLVPLLGRHVRWYLCGGFYRFFSGLSPPLRTLCTS